MFDDIIFESECDVLIALGNCLYKEAMIRDFDSDVNLFMEDGEQQQTQNTSANKPAENKSNTDNQSTTKNDPWWKRVAAWFRRTGKMIWDWFTSIPQKIHNFFNKQPTVSEEVAEELKKNGKNYPHCVLDPETGKCFCQIPKTFRDALELLTDESDNGIFHIFIVVSESVKWYLESKQHSNYNSNAVQLLRKKIQQISVLMNHAKQGNGELVTLETDGKDDLMNRLAKFGERVKKSKNSTFDELAKLMESANKEDGDVAKDITKQIMDVSNSLLQVIGTVNGFLKSALNQYQKELNILSNKVQAQNGTQPDKPTEAKVEKELSTQNDESTPTQGTENTPQTTTPQQQAETKPQQQPNKPYDFTKLKQLLANGKTMGSGNMFQISSNKNPNIVYIWPNPKKFPDLEKGTITLDNLDQAFGKFFKIENFNIRSRKNIVASIEPCVYDVTKIPHNTPGKITFMQNQL